MTNPVALFRQRLAETPAWRIWAMFGIALTMIVGSHYLVGRFTFGHDPQATKSLPYKTYIIDRHEHHYTVGDYAAFEAGHRYPQLPVRTFLKRIVAGPGGEIIVRNGVVFVDGDRRGTVDVGADYFGKPIDAFDRHVRLDVGEYWLMGIHERSLDSRYFGPVSSDRLVGRAYPIY